MAKSKIQTVLDNLATRNERVLRVSLQQWMGFATKQIQQDLTTKYIKKDVTTELTNWGFIEDQGQRTIKPAALKIMQTGGNAAYKQLAITGSFDVLNVRAVKAADKFCAKLVKDVTANTKKGVRTYISAGVKAGKAMPKIARELRPLVGLTKIQTESIINHRKLLLEKRPDLSAAQVDKRVMNYTNKTHRRRMENIARSETARAQNIGYCQGLEDVGVVEAEFQIAATDYCEECEALNHTRFPTSEAGGIIPVHPLCRCAMLPVVGEETITETLMHAPPELPGAMASEEGLLPWKKYIAQHTGEKPTSALLYDWYKLRYETTGKITGGTKKYLRAKAPKFEATSVKISKPIPGLEDIIKPVRIPPGPKPVDIVPKPVVPKPKPTLGAAPTRMIDGPLDDWDKYWDKYKGLKPDKMIRYDYLKQLPKEKLTNAQARLLAKYDEFWKDGVHRSINPVGDLAQWSDKLSLEEFQAVKDWKAGSYNLRKYQLGQITEAELKEKLLWTDVRWGGKQLSNAFSRAPNYGGTVYRGTGVYDDIARLKVGKRIEWNCNYSTSKSNKVAKMFLREGGENPVFFEIKTKTAIDTSRTTGVYLEQKEVVTRIGTQYRIKSVEKVKEGALKYTKVVLEEIDAKDMKPILLPKPKPPGLLPKSYLDEVSHWEDRLVKHKASLKKRLGFDIDALKMQRTDLPKYKEALAKFEKALKSYTKPIKNLDDARDGIWASAPDNKSVKRAKRNINKFYDKLEDIADDDFIAYFGRLNAQASLQKDRVFQGTLQRTRAHANPRHYNIIMSESDKVDIYFHELGHLLENHSKVKAKAYRWLIQRSDGRGTVPYQKICAWSKDPQRAFKDKFIDPYVGKIYGDGHTEAFSMGMQQFTSYKSMMRFAKKDFDHFAFIHGVLTGAI